MKKGKFLSYQYYQIYNDMLSSLRKSLIFILFLFLSFQFIKITQAILPLDIEIDTGTIYFRGEIAEFYILTSYNGTAVDSLLTLNLYGPSAISISSLTHIATGLYKARFQIPSNALTGVYTLVVSAIYDLGDGNIAKGISLKSFLISDKLTSWDSKLISIENKIATIQTDIGTIRGKIIRMEGNVMYIQTDLGEVKITIPKEFEKTRTSLLPPAYIAAIFAIIAVFILIFPFIKKKVKKKRAPSSHAES
jgi:hypothetical protein